VFDCIPFPSNSRMFERNEGLVGAHATPSRGRTYVKVRRQHFHFQDAAVVICLGICYSDYCKYGAMRRRRDVGSARYEIQRVFITLLAKL